MGENKLIQMSDLILDSKKYEQFFDVSIRRSILAARVRDITIGEPLVCLEYGYDYAAGPIKYLVKGTLGNVTRFIKRNRNGKLFLDYETEEPLFCTLNNILDTCVSMKYGIELQEALEYDEFYDTDSHTSPDDIQYIVL